MYKAAAEGEGKLGVKRRRGRGVNPHIKICSVAALARSCEVGLRRLLLLWRLLPSATRRIELLS
jgi:hypothetical protein